MTLTISQLAEQIDAELVCDSKSAEMKVDRVQGVEAARESDVTFIRDIVSGSGASSGSKYLRKLVDSRAGAVIVSKSIEGLDKAQLVVKNVDAGLIAALKLFAPKLKAYDASVDATAKIGKDVTIGADVHIGAYVAIADGAEIGSNAVISDGCRIGENSRIGDNSRLDCNVVVYHNCTIGENVIIQANSTIGSVGFGYSFINGKHELIPHNGGVVIEDFVEIGANTCIDRAKFGNTLIGAGSKIDNLVQIAHNVVIGKCCLIAGGCGLAGSSKLGDGVVMAGHAGVSDNVNVGSQTMIGARGVVLYDVDPKQQILGFPAIDKNEELRIIGLRRRLPKLAEQLRELRKRIKKLETSEDHKK
jgi:UDP-3-O-[3-hydroxymyristoyl] glucosamine N-acyltransferase